MLLEVKRHFTIILLHIEDLSWKLIVNDVSNSLLFVLLFEYIQHIDTICYVAKELWPDNGSGKTTAVVPTIDQVDKIVANTGPVVGGLQGIVTFANANKEKFPDLSTMPIKQYNVDKLYGDLETVKALPYA